MVSPGFEAGELLLVGEFLGTKGLWGITTEEGGHDVGWKIGRLEGWKVGRVKGSLG